MKFALANLNDSVGTSYLKTRTTLFGREAQKTVNSVNVIGPPLSRFIDTFNEAALTPGSSAYCSPNGRLFIPTAVTTGAITIALYNVNLDAGSPATRYQYVGKIILNLPNSASTTHTVRYLKVFDGANAGVTTGWKIFVGTLGSIVENGGNFMMNNVSITDFVPVGTPNFYPALTNNAKGIFQLQDPAAVGINTNITSIMGGVLDRTNSSLYMTSGTAGTFSIWGFDYTITPNVLTLPTVTPPTTGATWTSTGHGLSANDPVVMFSTGTVPTGFTASNQNAIPTVYWVNATNLTANTFELKTTKAGATSLSATGAATGTVSVVRAWGASTNTHLASRKTGTITSSFAGTALLADNQGITTINDSGSPNNGQLCYFFPTSTTFYHFRISDISTGATTLPTSSSANNVGNGADIVAPTTTFAAYSNDIGNIIYTASSFSFMTKKWINSQLTAQFGGQVNTWLENSGQLTSFFGMSAMIGMEERGGWLFVASNTIGQRGVFMVDMLSDDRFDFSYAISRVLDLGASSKLNFVTSTEQLYNVTDSTNVYIRSSSNPNDPMFDSPTGGWVYYSANADQSSTTISRYAQVKASHTILSLLSSTPSQLQDAVIGYTPVNELSDYWVGSVDNTSINGASPAYTAFRLFRTYSGSVPQIFFRAYDDSGNLVASANTIANPTFFEYSTNNGTSWTALGTIPNTVGTELRYKWALPPGVNVTVSIRES